MKNLLGKSFKCLILLAFTLPSLSFSAEKDLKGFDVFIEPGVSFGFGNYEIENSIDEGSFTAFDLGGRAGLKLGYIYLGFEYRAASPSSSSDRNVSDATRVRYPLMDDGNMLGVGVSLGYQWGIAQIWASVLSESLEQDLTLAGVDYTHEYNGIGYRFEISINAFRNVHLGLFAHQRNFDEYKSTHPTDTTDGFQDLDSAVRAMTYGFTISYFMPLFQFVEDKLF